MVQQASRKAVFPTHIAPYIDVAAYLLDARAPAATFFLDELLLGKELLLLTRAGQADGKTTLRWQKHFSEAGYKCLAIDSLSGQGLEPLLDRLAVLLRAKLRLAQRRGLAATTLRLVALGVPNVGKSTFLNRLIGNRRLRAADKPGVTKGYQWVRVFDDVEVLDTPGILRNPDMLNKRKPYWMLLNLMPYDPALTESAVELLRTKLTAHSWKRLLKYYRQSTEVPMPAEWMDLLSAVAPAISAKLGNPDGLERAGRRLLRDFQDTRFGRITLQTPEEDLISSPLFHGNVVV